MASPAAHVYPQTYQKPNAHADQLMPLLTGDEYKILDYATRKILGWQETAATRRTRISITTFEETGVSRPAIVAALRVLADCGALINLGHNREGTLWELRIDGNFELAGLQERLQAQKAKAQARISKARASLNSLKSDSEPEAVSPAYRSVQLTRKR